MAPQGETVNAGFAETSNQISVVTPSLVRLFQTDGQLLTSVENRLGPFAAISPVGGDLGIVVLRGSGDLVVFDDVAAQNQTAMIPSRAAYTSYRLSGDRLSFLRANAQTWDVTDLVTGTLRGSSPLGDGYQAADVSISADATLIFIGAVGDLPARLLDVATGTEVQQFGDATEGYFSFDDRVLATGRADAETAQIWRTTR